MNNASNESDTIKKILILFGVFIGLIVAVYIPRRNHFQNIKKDLAAVKKDIHYVETTAMSAGSWDEGVLRLTMIDRNFAAMFPVKEEEGLSRFEQKAQSFSIEILSTQARPRQAVEFTAGEDLVIDGKLCQKVLLSVNMRAKYNDLVRFLDDLKKPDNTFVTIERVTINKQDAADEPLYVVLDLQFYLIG